MVLIRKSAAITIVTMIAILMGIAHAIASAPDGSSVLGYWEPPKMDAVIEITLCDNGLCGLLIEHDYEALAQTDVNNPDETSRGRLLAGLPIIEGLQRTSDRKWKHGEFYDPRTGSTYMSKLKVLDDNRVKITACIGPGLCKGYIWTRVR